MISAPFVILQKKNEHEYDGAEKVITFQFSQRQG